MVTIEFLKNASRKQLIKYLENWGYQCYDRETTAELRRAAIHNFHTERA